MSSLRATNFLLLVIALCLISLLIKSNIESVNAAATTSPATTPVKIVSMPTLDVNVRVTNDKLPVKIDEVGTFVTIPVEVKNR